MITSAVPGAPSKRELARSKQARRVGQKVWKVTSGANARQWWPLCMLLPEPTDSGSAPPLRLSCLLVHTSQRRRPWSSAFVMHAPSLTAGLLDDAHLGLLLGQTDDMRVILASVVCPKCCARFTIRTTTIPAPPSPLPCGSILRARTGKRMGTPIPGCIRSGDRGPACPPQKVASQSLRGLCHSEVVPQPSSKDFFVRARTAARSNGSSRFRR